MAYTPQEIHSHDPITADWGNKVEQHLGRLGNYMGVVNTEAELPENPETGDWYMVLDKGKIYLWNGSKWIKVGGGGMARVSDTLRIDLSETFLQKSGISGTVDGSNKDFTLTDTPIWSGTVRLFIDTSDKSFVIPGENTSISLGESVVAGSISGSYHCGVVYNDFEYVSDNAFRFLKIPIIQNSVSINVELILQRQETPSGTIDGSNKSFTLSETPIPGSVVILSDDKTTIYDKGDGTLSDGGTVDYANKTITLNTAPSTSLSVSYDYVANKTLTDDGSGNLSDYGFIDYATGEARLIGKIKRIVSAEYKKKELITFIDDGQGNLSDGGTIDYSSGDITLANIPLDGVIGYKTGGSSILDNGDGTLSDGGTIDYDTGVVTLASAPSSSISAEYHQKIWDGIKWYPIGVSEDFPSKIEAFVGAEATASSFEIVVRLYDENDNLLLDSTPQTVNSDGEKHTLYFVFEDFSSLTLPDTVIIQLEVRVPPDAEGYTDFIEVRWS